MTISGLLLIKGTALKQDDFKMSLGSAKQIVVGAVAGLGVIVHLAAMSYEYREKALLKFSQVAGVKEIVTLTLKQ
ncbi:MAG TPA: hypothetical protein VM911_23400 [Pyrinomonadaceae bacterium]|nr:hypothetical protein [Pyrinomonadaceae bacterium]